MKDHNIVMFLLCNPFFFKKKTIVEGLPEFLFLVLIFTYVACISNKKTATF